MKALAIVAKRGEEGEPSTCEIDAGNRDFYLKLCHPKRYRRRQIEALYALFTARFMNEATTWNHRNRRTAHQTIRFEKEIGRIEHVGS